MDWVQLMRRIAPQVVMAGLVPAIHVLVAAKKGVDARVKPGHDDAGTPMSAFNQSTMNSFAPFGA
jgi:hypothetical protein